MRGIAGIRAPGQAPATLETVTLDLRDLASIRAAIDQVRPTILVNNAGVGTNHDALEATEAEWDEILDVNLKGLFFACQAAGRHMVERGYGRIVNLSSQAGHVGIRRNATYCASKGGVELLAKVLALEWGSRQRRGVRERHQHSGRRRLDSAVRRARLSRPPPSGTAARSCFGGLARSCRGCGPGTWWRSSHEAALRGPGDPVRPEEDAGFLPRRDGSDQLRCYGAARGLAARERQWSG